MVHPRTDEANADARPDQRLLFGADGRVVEKNGRGMMLAILRQAAARPAMTKRMLDTLKAIDEHAQYRSHWVGTYHEIAAAAGWDSFKSAQRGCSECERAGVLAVEMVGSRRITDADRRLREGRDTEAEFRFQIDWSALQEPAEPDPPAEQNVPLAEQFVPAAGQDDPRAEQNVPAAGQDDPRAEQNVPATSIRAVGAPSPPPPAEWREAEAALKSTGMGRWRDALERASNAGLQPPEVLKLVEVWAAIKSSLTSPEGALHERLTTAWPGQDVCEGWVIGPERVRQALDASIGQRIRSMSAGEIRELMDWAAAAYPNAQQLRDGVEACGWIVPDHLLRSVVEAWRRREGR